MDLAFYTPRVLSTGHTAHLSWGEHCTMPSYACTRVVCVGHELKYEANALAYCEHATRVSLPNI